MSAPDTSQFEQHSSVKISMTAKGEATVEVKAYTHDLDALDAARERAVQTYNMAVSQVRPQSGVGALVAERYGL